MKSKFLLEAAITTALTLTVPACSSVGEDSGVTAVAPASVP